MGTRSITEVIDTSWDAHDSVCSLHRSLDGYPACHGLQLAEFLADYKIVNGLRLDTPNDAKVANGAGCLAAQMVAHFKKKPGDFYLTSHDDCHDVDYVYVLYTKHDEPILIKVERLGSVVFSGNNAEFAAWCAADAEEG
jgi:hypothetical protein